jgi:hypothetical protein
VRVIDFDEAHKKGALDESNTVRLERELRQLGY